MAGLAAVAIMAVLALAGCSSPVEQPARAQDDLLAGKDSVQIVHDLEHLPLVERPRDLSAVVQPHGVVLTQAGLDIRLQLPDEWFYVAVAPYTEEPVDCFNRSLTAGVGELRNLPLNAHVVETGSGRVLAGRERRTTDSGFVGFWLPRETSGTITLSHGELGGSVDFSTHDDGPTCLPLRLTD